MIAFLTSKWGLIFVAVALTAVGLIWWTLHAEAAGAVAVLAAGLAKAAERAQAAQKARSEVDHSNAAVKADKFNRDRK